jgi:hypothetical protein
VRKILSIDDVSMGDVLMYKNLLGIVSFFADDSDVILETIVEIEIMTPEGVATLSVGSDYAVDVLDCELVVTRNAMNNPHIEME